MSKLDKKYYALKISILTTLINKPGAVTKDDLRALKEEATQELTKLVIQKNGNIK